MNASFNDQNGTYVGNTEGEYAGYTTSIIANKSIEWVKKVVRSNETSRTHTRTHAHSHARTHAHTYIHLSLARILSFPHLASPLLALSERMSHH